MKTLTITGCQDSTPTIRKRLIWINPYRPRPAVDFPMNEEKQQTTSM
jgi:hypothetical protein